MLKNSINEQGELCIHEYGPRDLALGVAVGVALVAAAVVAVAYRNYRYEQELDLLLWKVDSKDIVVRSMDNFVSEVAPPI